MPEERNTIGRPVPDVRLVGAGGRSLSLMEVIGGKPLILSLIYTRCQTTCLLITDSLIEVVDKMGGLGEKYSVLTLSFDPADTPESLEEFRRRYGLDRKGWFVAGGSNGELKRLLNAIDFQYILDKATGEFIHPNLLVILTPDGRVSRYIYGVSYKERDLRLSLLNAKKGISSLSIPEGILLRCYKFNPLTGTYETDWAFIMHMIGGGAFFFTVFAVLWGKKVILTLRKALFSAEL
ncbi:MAG: SCO family protein [Thermodesulfovibrionales bacterium]